MIDGDEPRAKILLVDDRPENLVALEAILQSLGEELVSVGSGEEALKRLLTEEYAVILLDVQMPGMDGFETAAHIKRRERTRHLPIIFLTAISSEPGHAFRGYTAGAADYLAKPFDPWVLRAKVAVFVELFRTNRRLAEQAEQLRRRERAPVEALEALDAAEQALRAADRQRACPEVAEAVEHLGRARVALTSPLPAQRPGARR
ncbi:MAG TPA: response regulator [Mycobacteriales bacterium]|nr:response regulator [Mycobacteriales bacterium]